MNEENRKQIIIAGVLGAVLIGVLVYQFVLAGDPPPAGGATTKTEKAATPRGASRTPSRAAGAQASVAVSTELDIEELTRSVEVMPINYAMVRIRRNLMEPLVGGISLVPSTMEAAGDEEAGGVPVRAVARRNVTGILWDSRRPVAIIDNIVVHEGYEFADGVVVHEIEPTRVLLKIGESISPLEMKEF